MDEGAKRRLVGATVLVVLVVIFLPMLLEEEAPSPVPEGEMSVPPRPDFDRGYDASITEGPAEPSAPSLPESGQPMSQGPSMPRELPPTALFQAPAIAEPELVPESEIPPEESEPEFISEPEPQPEIESEPEFVSEPEPEAEQESEPAPVQVQDEPPVAVRKPEPKVAPKPRPSPARSPTPAQASASVSSWVIQVASLQERSRAYALVQDLRAKGFPAYLEEAEVKQKRWHRVRVGPEVERKRIESMAASLEAKTGLKGQIQRYP